MTFEHYILTRFALSYFEGVGDACLDEQYLDYRFSLFESVCLPSVKSQTCQNFKWLVLFDSRTPTRFKKRIEALQKDYPQLLPCYIDLKKEADLLPVEKYIQPNDEYETVVRGLSKNADTLENDRPSRIILPGVIHRIIDLHSCSPDYYVTTRLDNDDALHKDYVSIVQQKVLANPQHVIFDFVNTYKFILDEGIVYRYSLENGHFLTLVEPADGLFQTILFWNHLYASRFVETLHFHQRPLQLELVHKNNYVNAFTELSVAGLIEGLVYFREKDFGLKNTTISRRKTLLTIGSLLKHRLIGT